MAKAGTLSLPMFAAACLLMFGPQMKLRGNGKLIKECYYTIITIIMISHSLSLVNELLYTQKVMIIIMFIYTSQAFLILKKKLMPYFCLQQALGIWDTIITIIL